MLPSILERGDPRDDASMRGRRAVSGEAGARQPAALLPRSGSQLGGAPAGWAGGGSARINQEQSLLGGPDGHLRAGADVELGEDVADVGVGRPLADYQPLGDLAVGAAQGDQRR